MTNRKLILPDSPHLSEDDNGRLCAPSATRNLVPIRLRLDPLIPKRGKVLELASGTGQQITSLAKDFPDTEWQPSDLDKDRLSSIRAWRDSYAGPNLLTPVSLDVAGEWPKALSGFDLIFVVNLFHLITEENAYSTIRSAAAALSGGGHFFVYGPFKEGQNYRSAGDRTFDASLQSQNPDIGYKDCRWMRAQMEAAGLSQVMTHEMPANNLALVAALC